MTRTLLTALLSTSLFLASGALDAGYTPLQMKKHRPGVQLQVLTTPERKADFIAMILRRTTTFGVKATEVERYCLRRRREELKTPLGALEVKVGFWGDEILRVTPEYESCRRLAKTNGIGLPEAFARAQAAIQKHYFEPAGKSAKTRRRSSGGGGGRT